MADKRLRHRVAGMPYSSAREDRTEAAAVDVEAVTTALAGTYVPSDPVISVEYNPDGTVDSVTENGIETTFTYNADGTVATSTRLGVTRTYTYVGDNLTAVA